MIQLHFCCTLQAYSIGRHFHLHWREQNHYHSELCLLKRTEDRLKQSKWVKMESGGGVAKLTLTHLAKDDEGLYTLRMVTKGGDAVHKAYVYVKGKKK